RHAAAPGAGVASGGRAGGAALAPRAGAARAEGAAGGCRRVKEDTATFDPAYPSPRGEGMCNAGGVDTSPTRQRGTAPRWRVGLVSDQGELTPARSASEGKSTPRLHVGLVSDLPVSSIRSVLYERRRT